MRLRPAAAKSHGTRRRLPARAMQERAYAALSVIATTGSLIVYGLMQERVMTIGWGDDGEIFKHSVFLVLCNRIVTSLITFACMVYSGSRVVPAAPLSAYGLVSVTNVVATSCQYEALKYVSFAVQTLAKSAKALPVMLWASICIGRRYRCSEFTQALSVTLGCTAFLLSGDISSRVPRTDGYSGAHALLLGASLMMLYLAVDGLTSTWQDQLFKTYSMEISDQVLFTTAFSALFSFVAALASNQLLPSLEFLLRHPEAMVWFLGLSAASCVVQLCISHTIKQYGALVFATIMTTRQFFSILLSSLVFAKPFSSGQWASIAVVFTALYLQAFSKASKKGRSGPNTPRAGDRATKFMPLPGESPEQAISAAWPDSGSLPVITKRYTVSLTGSLRMEEGLMPLLAPEVVKSDSPASNSQHESWHSAARC